MNKIKPDIPLWAKVGSRVWVEVRDSGQLEVLEYTEGVVTHVDYDAKELKVKDMTTNEDKEMRGDRIHEREEKHAIVNDLADIPTLNDAELLKHLEIRYRNNLIHCYCGPTLIVINPYKKIEHEESEDTRNAILKCLMEKRLKDTSPHVWTVSAIAWDYMLTQNQNQAICISGESGAGKTECTKRCLEFITQMKSESRSVTHVPIEQKIMSCNPLLEAFGNSKTFRNDNSSRFGKYTTLFVERHKKTVKGASIENYLLEKSRITNLAKEERNYHILYAMCRFMPNNMKSQYKLLDKDGVCRMESFNYLNQSSIYETPKVNDKEFYDDVEKSFKDLDFSPGQQDAIWRMLASILHLGNLRIDESTYEEGSKACRIFRDETWEKVIALLQIDQNSFEEALTNKEIRVGASVTKSPLSPARTQNSIDTIARELYNRLFNWIVKKLNKTLLPTNPQDPNFLTIGVLDIFGFEIFGKNSIEQLFINFANEKLQGLYIDYIFKNECRIFEEEGLAQYTSLIEYKDNKPLLISLDNAKMPPGVFDLIDQTCSLNKNDETLHSEIMKTHKNSNYIGFPKFAKQLSFIVKHTARDVEYLTDGFVEKNKDELSVFLQNAIDTSHFEVVQIFNEISGLGISKIQNEEVKKNPKEKYLGYKFRRNMDDLINTLARCYCHFVRCIKPNEQKKSDFWNGQLALMQIRYMGLLDSLKVRKLSYPFRFEYKKFFEFYQDLDMGANGSRNFNDLVRDNANFLELCKELLKYCGVSFVDKDLLYGKTRIFLNEKFKIQLDKALMVKQKAKKEALKTISDLYKSYVCKRESEKFFRQIHHSIAIAKDLLGSWTAKIDSMKHKNYMRTVVRFQKAFRAKLSHRELRLKSNKMQVVSKYLGLFKFTKMIFYVLNHKRKILLMQSLLDRKVLDSKRRFCKEHYDFIFESAWIQIKKNMIDYSSLYVQRTFRSYLMRKRLRQEYQVLNTKVEEGKVHTAATNIQRFARGFLVRNRYRNTIRAVRKIQGFVKMVWLREYFRKVLKSTYKLQKFFRKMYFRRMVTNPEMQDFLQINNQSITDAVNIEYGLLFSDDVQAEGLGRGPFQSMDARVQPVLNYKQFIPASKEIELNKNAKLASILIDVNIHMDTSSVYENPWAFEFASFLKKIHNKGARLLHLEIGESFTIAVTDDKEVHTWGVNDHGQCCRLNDDFFSSNAVSKNLSSAQAKIITAGKDHSLLVDEFGNVYSWGKNSEGQLGLGHTRSLNEIIVHSAIKDPIRAVACKEGVSYAVSSEGKVVTWPQVLTLDTNSMHTQEVNAFRPYQLSFPIGVKISNVSSGSDFAVFLANNGLLYSIGENKFGELGLGDRHRRIEPILISALKDANEKIIEISCGHKHTIVQSVIGKLYTWGLNDCYQLGQDDKKPRLTPVKFIIPGYDSIRVKIRSAQAGFTSTVVLLEDRQIYFSGVMGANKRATSRQPSRLIYEEKVS
jgi:myosin-5